MTFRQFLSILKARRLPALMVFGVLLVLPMILVAFFPKTYSATASVVVDAKTDPLSNAVISGDMIPGFTGTQVDIAGSERVALEVVKALELDRDPALRGEWQRSKWLLGAGGQGNFRAWLAARLLKKLTVKPSLQSNVINITAAAEEADTAAARANAFAQAYIDTNVALKVDMAKQYANAFEERSRSLRAGVEAKQKALSDFEAANDMVAADGRLDIETARLGELSSQLVAVQAQRQESQSRQRQGGDVGSRPEVLGNPVIASLKADLSKAQARLEDNETHLGANHPLLVSNQAEVASLRARLAEETARIIASLGNTTRVNERRESEIAQALEAQRARIVELKHERDQADVLRNDVTIAQRNLDTVAQRLAQSDLEGATDQTNIAELTPATEPSGPSSPKYLIVLGICLGAAMFFGVVTALLLELNDQRIRSADDLPAMLGVPVYGTIARIAYPALAAAEAHDLPQLTPSAA